MTRRVAHTAQIGALVLALAVVPAGLAAKGDNGRGKPGGGSGSSSLQLATPPVYDANGNGLPNVGDTVTFNVSTAAARPFVSVHCYQGNALVYAASAGFFPDYPWSRDFNLATTSWTSGKADCTAKLYTTKDGIRLTTLATLAFQVSE
jgi:hypothetical protein